MEQTNNNTQHAPAKDPMPVDPSNTSNIGQHVEEGVVKIKEGINRQSSEWEDRDERGSGIENENRQAK